MKEKKSLRMLAKELGVSHSYLSQVLHGKRPPSERVARVVSNYGKQLVSKSDIGRAGFEPATNGLKVRCSTGLS